MKTLHSSELLSGNHDSEGPLLVLQNLVFQLRTPDNAHRQALTAYMPFVQSSFLMSFHVYIAKQNHASLAYSGSALGCSCRRPHE